MKWLKLLFYHLTPEKVLFYQILVIPKSWNWDAANPGIRDWLRWPGRHCKRCRQLVDMTMLEGRDIRANYLVLFFG